MKNSNLKSFLLFISLLVIAALTTTAVAQTTSSSGELNASSRRTAKVWPAVQQVSACYGKDYILVSWAKHRMAKVIGYNIYNCYGQYQDTSNGIDLNNNPQFTATQIGFVTATSFKAQLPAGLMSGSFCVAPVTYYGSYENLSVPVPAVPCN